MRGISAKSLEEVLSAVETAGQGASVDLGTELFGVVGVLDGSPALRRVLTDPSTEADAKAGLATSVLGDKVSDATLSVVATAVRGRWSAGRDLTDALETAGVVAVVAAAKSAGGLDTLETEMFDVGRIVAADAELRGVVSDRTVPVAPKVELLDRLLADKVSEPTLAVVHQAVAARTGSFERVLTRFGEVVAERRDRLAAVVRAAYPLGESERDRLAEALRGRYGREVHLNVVVDPTVVGGIAVSVGDEVVDGTMSSRLEAARRQLAG